MLVHWRAKHALNVLTNVLQHNVTRCMVAKLCSFLIFCVSSAMSIAGQPSSF